MSQNLKCSSNTVNRAKAVFRVYMLRHGESEYNKKNLFCGWYDSELSEQGKEEARNSGRLLKEQKANFDIVYTSVLKRSKDTAAIVLDEMNLKKVNTCQNWRLNERHYGALTGLNRVDTVKKYGEEKVQEWRRSYATPPPPMTEDHPYYDIIRNDPRYKGDPKPDEFPMFESLKMTEERCVPYWLETIVPAVIRGFRVIIVAHGNSLRSIIHYCEKLSDEEITKLNLPTGIPFYYDFDIKLNPVGTRHFLADEAVVKAAMDKVANQIKTDK